MSQSVELIRAVVAQYYPQNAEKLLRQHLTMLRSDDLRQDEALEMVLFGRRAGFLGSEICGLWLTDKRLHLVWSGTWGRSVKAYRYAEVASLTLDGHNRLELRLNQEDKEIKLEPDNARLAAQLVMRVRGYLGGGAGLAQQLERLAKLRQSGGLSEAEYNQAKKKLLG